MQLPTIHTNGTAREVLIDALCQANLALEQAYSALKETAPNGRDYYLQEATAFQLAVAEHNSRLRQINAVKDEIEAMALVISES